MYFMLCASMLLIHVSTDTFCGRVSLAFRWGFEVSELGYYGLQEILYG